MVCHPGRQAGLQLYTDQFSELVRLFTLIGEGTKNTFVLHVAEIIHKGQGSVD